MLLRDVLTNLKNHDFEIGNYPLCEAEARGLIEAVERVMEDEKEEEHE